MNHLGVLIDFSELCHTSVAFAAAIAKKNGCPVSLVHVSSGEQHELEAKMTPYFDPYIKSLTDSGVKAQVELHFGDFESIIPVLVNTLNIDLLVIGTHGVRGVKQFLFGSNILRLVQTITAPSLVVQQNSKIPTEDQTEILFPLASHHDFIKKVEATAKFSSLFNSKVLIYSIQKTEAGLSEELKRNRALAIQYFSENGISHEELEEDATVYSFGYGKQINQYAADHSVDFISILSRVSSNTVILGNADKERILLNDASIPVLCTNG